MTRGVLFCLLVPLFRLTSTSDVNAYPPSPLEDADGLEQKFGSPRPFGRLAEENDLAPRRDKDLQKKIQEILGIPSQSESPARREVPPQFMMELYNTITDPNGVTRGQNPYNAKIVRSFIEKDSTLPRYYFFNVTGLETNESVLGAELHLYRKRMPRSVRPLTTVSPHYLIRVYQVLDDRSLDAPDLHRLLNARRVGARASGWQVFNVKRAVLEWLSGKPNLGLLVTVSTMLEDEATVEFTRRNDYHQSKQPILVLFDDVGADRGRSDVSRYYAYNNQEDDEDREMEEEEQRLVYARNAKAERIDLEDNYDDTERYVRRERQRGQLEETQLVNRREPEFFQRQKRRRDEEDDAGVRRRRDAASKRRIGSSRGIVSGNTTIVKILTSMDIYARAAFRERLGQTARDRSSKRSIARERRSAAIRQNDTGECARHELYVDYRNIEFFSSIIGPAGYSAYQCKGVCESPLSQDQQPTNHATIQAIVHKMGLVQGVERPCCVPTKLLSTDILFYDDNKNVVLKVYEDMVAGRCGCR